MICFSVKIEKRGGFIIRLSLALAFKRIPGLFFLLPTDMRITEKTTLT
jgi:hypothetical protein